MHAHVSACVSGILCINSEKMKDIFGAEWGRINKYVALLIPENFLYYACNFSAERHFYILQERLHLQVHRHKAIKMRERRLVL